MFVLAFLAARVYDAVTESDGVAGLDAPLLRAASQLRTPWLDGVAEAVAYGFGPIGMPVIAVLACVALAVRRRSITPMILVVAAGTGSLRCLHGRRDHREHTPGAGQLRAGRLHARRHPA